MAAFVVGLHGFRLDKFPRNEVTRIFESGGCSLTLPAQGANAAIAMVTPPAITTASRMALCT
jgi:hypothetical protein